MSFAMQFLHSAVVGVLVRYKERSLDVTTVGVFPLSIEHFFIQRNVVIVNGIIEGDGDHLGNFFRRQIPGNVGSVFGTETIGQDAHGRITWWSSVRIVLGI